MFVRKNPKPMWLLIALMVAAIGSPIVVQAESETASEMMQRFERERKALDAKRAEDDRLRKLDQERVAKQLKNYRLPQLQSRCPDFVPDWNQITTVQAYMQFSLGFAKNLGNCLHAETKANAEALAADMKKANIGKTAWSWSGQGMPDSIDAIGPFAKFSANYARCDVRCFDRFNELLDEAADISKKKRDQFMAQWDQVTENNIKPAMKARDAEAYKANNLDQEFANYRAAISNFAFTRSPEGE